MKVRDNMKQHITAKQLKELSNEQQIRVATLAGEYGNCCNGGGETINLEKLSYRINIGKMIEIISNYVYDINTFQGHGYWDTIVTVITEDEEKKYASEWLCDALWECMKEISLGITKSEV